MMSLAQEAMELETYWNELLYVVCKGLPESINALRKYEIFDFFDYLESNIKHK
jgi:hypothetical protein